MAVVTERIPLSDGEELVHLAATETEGSEPMSGRRLPRPGGPRTDLGGEGYSRTRVRYATGRLLERRRED
jgi:hypothetical protein